MRALRDSSALGADFGRLGFNVIDELRAIGPATAAQLAALDRVADFRNAISHGKAANIAALERSGEITSTLRSYAEHRKRLEALAATIDTVVARQLVATLGIPPPW